MAGGISGFTTGLTTGLTNATNVLAHGLTKHRGSSAGTGNRKHHGSTAKQEDDMLNIFGSDIVSGEFIMDQVQRVKHNTTIVKLEIEDLLIASIHHSFLSVFKALIVCDQRKWKYVRFVDSFERNEYAWWESLKNMHMREYESSVDELELYAGIVSFHANVQVGEGTSKRDLIKLFKSIYKDKDVRNVTFEGCLFGHNRVSAAEKLVQFFDDNDSLTSQLVVSIACGWTAESNDRDNENTNDSATCTTSSVSHDTEYWRDLLKACVYALKAPGNTASTASTNSLTNSDCGFDDDSISVTSSLSCSSFNSARFDSTPRRAPRRARSTRSVRSCSRSPMPVRQVPRRMTPNQDVRRQMSNSIGSNIGRSVPQAVRVIPRRTASHKEARRSNSASLNHREICRTSQRSTSQRSSAGCLYRSRTGQDEGKTQFSKSWSDISGPDPRRTATTPARMNARLTQRKNTENLVVARPVHEKQQSIIDIVKDLQAVKTVKESDSTSSFRFIEDGYAVDIIQHLLSAVDIVEKDEANEGSKKRSKSKDHRRSKRNNAKSASCSDINAAMRIEGIAPDFDWAAATAASESQSKNEDLEGPDHLLAPRAA